MSIEGWGAAGLAGFDAMDAVEARPTPPAPTSAPSPAGEDGGGGPSHQGRFASMKFSANVLEGLLHDQLDEAGAEGDVQALFAGGAHGAATFTGDGVRAFASATAPQWLSHVGSDEGKVHRRIEDAITADPPRIDEVLDIMDPMPIGGEFDEMLKAMPPGLMGDFVKGLANSGHAKFERFAKWIADPRCDPEVKRKFLQAVETHTSIPSDTGRAVAGAMAAAIRSDPRGMSKLLAKHPEVLTTNAKIAEAFAESDPKALAVFIAARPHLMQSYTFAKAAGEALTPEMLGSALSMMRKNGELTQEEQDALGTLVQFHLAAKGGDDPAKVAAAAKDFLAQMEEAGIEATPESSGFIMGAITAGLIKHFRDIKADAEDVKEFAEVFMDVAAGLAGYNEAWGPLIGAFKDAVKGMVSSAVSGGDVDYDAIASRFRGAYQNWLDERSAWAGPDADNRQQRDDALRALQRMLDNNGCGFGV